MTQNFFCSFSAFVHNLDVILIEKMKISLRGIYEYENK
jgi:hypothetical protein